MLINKHVNHVATHQWFWMTFHGLTITKDIRAKSCVTLGLEAHTAYREDTFPGTND